MKNIKKHIQSLNGFTLVEILVVISIISILFVILMPQINASFIKSQEAGVKSDFRVFQLAMETYMHESKGKNIKMPQLNDHLDKGHAVREVGSMMQTLSLDPWGTPYEVEFGNRKILFTSYGKDEKDDAENYAVTTYYHEGIIDSCTTGFDSGNIKLSSITDIPIGFTCGDDLSTAMAPPKESLPTPKNFVATTVTNNQVTLNWDSVTGATSYVLKRNGTTIYMGSSTSFTDLGLVAGTDYTYTVSAKNTTAVSAAANLKVTTVLSAPGTPTHLVASDVTDTSLVLNWNPVPRATSYKLERNGTVIYTGSSNSFSDSGLTFNQAYSYSLIAINNTGQSSPYTISVTTKLMEVGDGIPTNPYIIYNVEQLQRVDYCLTCHFELGNDIDSSSATSWNGGTGFSPIRSRTSEQFFSGQLDGKNFTIHNMTLNRPTEDWVAIFDYLSEGATLKNINVSDSTSVGKDNVALLVGGVAAGATLSNIHVDGKVTGINFIGGISGYSEGEFANVSSNSIVIGEDRIGGITGENYGTVSIASFDGNVTGTIRSIGGVAGYNEGSISQASSEGTVTGTSFVGGVVGLNESNLTDSSSSATVYGTVNEIGGVVGCNHDGTIERVISSATVNGDSDAIDIGGVIGGNHNALTDATSTATVEGYDGIGGVVGSNFGIADEVTFTGQVVGINNVGGLVGLNKLNSTLKNSASDSYASGVISIGGAVGGNIGNVLNVTASSNVEASDSEAGGLVGRNDGLINGSVVTADVNSDYQAGGIVGDNNGDIDNVSFIGSVTGDESIGGIAGANDGRVTNSTTKAVAFGFSYIGGLIGYNGTDAHLENLTVLVGSEIDGTEFIGGGVGQNNGVAIKLASHATVTGYQNVGGVFGFTQNTVTNLTSSGHVEGQISVGGIAGESSGNLKNAQSTANVVGIDKVGGIVGRNYILIENTAFNGNVNGDNKVGGIAGENEELISLSHSLGNVNGKTKVGGLVGKNDYEVVNSYSKSKVVGTSDVGGLVGDNTVTITNSYSTGLVTGTSTKGGLVGLNGVGTTIANSYYNSVTSGQSDTGKGSARTTTQMKSQSTFVGWNFTSVWAINPSVNEGYPGFK